MFPSPSKADDIVTVGGIKYDISSVTTSFVGDVSALEATPWWGNATLATSLASAVGSALGTGVTGDGPLFADLDGLGGNGGAVWYIGTGSVVGYAAANDGDVSAYAVGTIVTTSTPEPGALGMMLAGLVGLGLLVGVRRHRGNHLASAA
jgi:hypothetical protein